MQVCADCGNALRDNARFCPGCGSSIAPPTAPKSGSPPVVGPLPPVGPPLGPSLGGPPTGPPLPSRGSNRRALSWGAVGALLSVVLVAVVAIALFAATGGDEGDAAARTPLRNTETDDTEADAADFAPTTEVTSPPVTAAPAPLTPVSASASNTRAAVPRRNCGGSVDFEAENLIDGDDSTGWGAFEGDGTGQSITIGFAGRRRFTEVGLTPGFLNVAPRSDFGCEARLAFDYNRFVTSVRWTFEDGTSVTQSFDRVPEIQFIDVDAVSSSVTITLLGTEFQGGEFGDEDTVLSEAAFFGTTE